jgi:hypothetical protein
MTDAAPSSTERRRAYPDYMTMMVFSLITSSALIGVPAFALVYGYTWLD